MQEAPQGHTNSIETIHITINNDKNMKKTRAAVNDHSLLPFPGKKNGNVKAEKDRMQKLPHSALLLVIQVSPGNEPVQKAATRAETKQAGKEQEERFQ